MKKSFIVVSTLLGAFAFAGGFRVSLQGVKQLAMAHTSAHTDDASVAFFNPAGISFIDNKFSVALGVFGVKTKIDYQNLNTRETFGTDSPLSTPAYFSVAYKATEKLSVGLNLATPFGSTVDWGEHWAGNEIVQKIEVKTFFFEPIVSIKVAKWASVGASFIYAKGSVDWSKAVNQLGGTMNILDKKASGYGFGVGVYLRPTKQLDVSIAYRSKVDMDAKNGIATFNVSPALYPNLKLNSEGKDAFTATIPLIDEYTFGITYKVTPKWSISTDVNYYGWSKYDKLTLDFENAVVGNQQDKTVLVSPKNYKDAMAFRIGTQYMLTEKLAARLGYYHDESPYTDENFSPETPSFNANVLTGGLGYRFGKSTVNLSGAYNFMQSRTVKNALQGFYGEAKGRAFYFGLGFSYNPF